MANLLIRDIPETVYRKLRIRAKRQGTSMNREALQLLARGLGEVAIQDPEEFMASVRELRRTLFVRGRGESLAKSISKMRAAR